MKQTRRRLLKLYVTPAMPHAVFSYDPPVPYVGSIEHVVLPAKSRENVHVKVRKQLGFLYGVEIWADKPATVTVWAVSSAKKRVGSDSRSHNRR